MVDVPVIVGEGVLVFVLVGVSVIETLGVCEAVPEVDGVDVMVGVNV